MAKARVEVVRVYEDLGRRPGEDRVLIDRLRPRGVQKAAVDFDEWAKDVAPSTDLRRWYRHDPERFGEFARRYRAELDHDPGASAAERLRMGTARFVIEVSPPFRLDLTGTSLLVAVRQEPDGGPGRVRLAVELRRRGVAPSEAGLAEVRRTLEQMLGLEIDLVGFHELAAADRCLAGLVALPGIGRWSAAGLGAGDRA